MKKELSSDNIIYNFAVDKIKKDNRKETVQGKEKFYEEIKESINIKKEGFNIYLVDDFSKNKLEDLKKFITSNSRCNTELEDICYIIYEDTKKPKSIKIEKGKGIILKDTLEEIQEHYFEITYNFYNNIQKNEEITNRLKKIKDKLIADFIDQANEEDFDIKFSQYGFSFMPLKNGKVMKEGEYEELPRDEKEEILSKINNLKKKSKVLLNELENLENEAINKIKVILLEYYKGKEEEIKCLYKHTFDKKSESLNFLEHVCNSIKEKIIDNYTLSYDNDEEEIKNIIYKYAVNVLVDNKDSKDPPIIFDDDPNINNLLGCIKYENKNGVYKADVKYIKAGDILNANGGYLILRADSLLRNPISYYYLKKSLMAGKINYENANRYLEIISLNGIEPECVEFNEKVIIIGDYKTYDLLYNYDEDFKKIFKIKVEYNPIIKVNQSNKEEFIKKVLRICDDNDIKISDTDNINEIARFLSRKCEDREKIYFDEEEIKRILVLANEKAKSNKKNLIEESDIVKVAYKKDIIEEEIYEEFEEGRILIDVLGTHIGQVNGLAVIDMGHFCFGKPFRITCMCYKGDGNVIDVEKENNLSGNIHNKAISILKGCINNLVGGYSKLPIDFHICFEQLYGSIEGDSASVGEFISMISSLTKIPIKQNIAVTGSINQFGNVQPIGGVSTKIEGFYNVCKNIDKIEGKAVLIPNSNRKNIILNKEVEDDIRNNKFHIYVMKDIKDAIEVLMCDEKTNYAKVMDTLNKELKKYYKK